MSSKRFRIAFSFAGEKRAFVKSVADLLAARFSEAAILYDKFHKAEFSRDDLAFYLPKLYRNETDLDVAVFCPDYHNKEWCGLEWKAIFDLLKTGHSKEVMLTRFGHVEGEGLFSLAGYTDLQHETPESTVAVILERLALNEGHPKDHYTKITPTRPAVITKPSTPNNLPPLYSFFGREKELKTIADALAPEARTWGALIDGPGGMGKTSLAIRAAEMVPANRFKQIIFLSAKERELTADGQRPLKGFVLPSYLQMLNELPDSWARDAAAPWKARLHLSAVRHPAMIRLSSSSVTCWKHSLKRKPTSLPLWLISQARSRRSSLLNWQKFPLARRRPRLAISPIAPW